MDQLQKQLVYLKEYVNRDNLEAIRQKIVVTAMQAVDTASYHEKNYLRRLRIILENNKINLDDAVAYYSYVFLIVLALVPIYVGSKRVIKSEALDNNKEKEEELSKNDAMMFPLYASISLFGLYCIFSVFGKEYVNYLLTGYFCLLGSHTAGHMLHPLVKSLTPKFISFMHHRYDLLLTSGELDCTKEVLIDIAFDYTNIVSTLIGCVIGVWYLFTKHWLANNLFALGFCLFGIEQLKLEGYQVGCILLGGLFFYDIFWVFGTDVMVTVATSFEAPIKLLVPKDIFQKGFINATKFGLLGLGDIVIPGIMVALYLRFDAKINPKGFPIYFYTAIFSYLIGLIITMGIMHVFKHAQPALLYLVPTVLGFPTMLSIVRGEFGQLLSFEADVDDESSTTTEVEKKQKDD